MLLELANLAQLKLVLAKHQESRPDNHDIPNLTRWSHKKDEIQAQIAIRAHDAGRQLPLYNPSPAPALRAKAEAKTQEQHQVWISQRLNDLAIEIKLTPTLQGKAKKNSQERCSSIRHAIRSYALRHGLTPPDMPAVGEKMPPQKLPSDRYARSYAQKVAS